MKTTVPLFLAALLPLAICVEAAPKPKTPPAKPAATVKPAPPAKPAEKPARAVPVVAPIKLPATATGYNKLVIDAIRRMPLGGGYSANSAATSKLVEASSAKKDSKGGLGFQPTIAQPSYCSGATYLVFLEVVNDLVKSGKVKLSQDVIAMLGVQRQMDGAGIWGRWNANGPGTGSFFHEARLGRNIVGHEQAEPGDFLKIWWNEHVGKRERGHSVIFLGHEKTAEGEPGIRFWSSNEPEGMSAKVVPLTKVKRALVSRFEHPEKLSNLDKLPPKDAFLASMLEKDATDEEYMKSIGLPVTAAAAPAPAPAENGSEKIVVQLDGVPDEATPAPPADPADPATAFMGSSRYAAYTLTSKRAIIQLVQMRLKYDGVFVGTADGKPGANTTDSLKKWQTEAGLDATGVLDAVTLLKLGLNDLKETRMPQPAPAARAGPAATVPQHDAPR